MDEDRAATKRRKAAPTREDMFGHVKDVHGAVDRLRVRELPRRCVAALQEGFRDSQERGLGAWRTHDRVYYVAFAMALVILGVVLLRRLAGARRQAPPPPWAPWGPFAPAPHPGLAPFGAAQAPLASPAPLVALPPAHAPPAHLYPPLPPPPYARWGGLPSAW